MFVVGFVGAAFAWEHTEFVHTEPFVLELTTVDSELSPPGAVQEAVRRAAALWTDDACLETLDFTVVDTPENVAANDGANRVSVNQDVFGGDVVTYTYGSEDAFTRFGSAYRSPSDVDITFALTEWALADEVRTGTCDGPPLDLYATTAIGYALGLADSTAPDSVFLQPDCTLPELAADDRAGLRALYGSGVDLFCALENVTFIGVGQVSGAFADCVSSTYGASPLLSLEWIADGETVYPDPPEIVFDTVGVHTLELCGTFDVPEGCDQPTSCVPMERDFLVCAPMEAEFTAVVTPNGTLELSDLTVFSDELCTYGRMWSVSDDLGVLDTETDGDVEIELPEPGVYEVALQVGFGDDVSVATGTVEWVSDEPDPDDETPADPPDDGEAEEEKGGCGCASTGASGGWAGLLALGLVRRRRS